jgi:hypothetical protein
MPFMKKWHVLEIESTYESIDSWNENIEDYQVNDSNGQHQPRGSAASAWMLLLAL